MVLDKLTRHRLVKANLADYGVVDIVLVLRLLNSDDFGLVEIELHIARSL